MVTLANDRLLVEIAEAGAELRSLKTLPEGAEWLWQGDAAWWTGRSPLLFPIVGQCPEGEVEIEGALYAMRSHGFARNSDFALSARGEHWAEFTLAPNEISRACYPFDFRLIVTYRLEGAGLSVTARVENRDSRAMPFQFGFHPAFSWPLPGAGNAAHVIHFPDARPSSMHRLAGGLMARERLAPPITGDFIVMSPEDYRADAMVFPELGAKSIRFEAGSSAIEMEVEGLPDFALWQKPEAPFLCLEPWHGMAPYPDLGKALAARPNAISLAAGEARVFTMKLGLHAK